jgi:hypothetical protein
MRVPPSVEEDQMACVRPDHHAVPFHRIDARCRWIIPEDEFPARTGQMIGAEEKARQRIGVDVALEPHRVPPLNVQDDAVPVITSRHDAFHVEMAGEF